MAGLLRGAVRAGGHCASHDRAQHARLIQREQGAMQTALGEAREGADPAVAGDFLQFRVRVSLIRIVAAVLWGGRG